MKRVDRGWGSWHTLLVQRWDVIWAW